MRAGSGSSCSHEREGQGRLEEALDVEVEERSQIRRGCQIRPVKLAPSRVETRRIQCLMTRSRPKSIHRYLSAQDPGLQTLRKQSRAVRAGDCRPSSVHKKAPDFEVDYNKQCEERKRFVSRGGVAVAGIGLTPSIRGLESSVVQSTRIGWVGVVHPVETSTLRNAEANIVTYGLISGVCGIDICAAKSTKGKCDPGVTATVPRGHVLLVEGSMADWKLENCCDRQQVAFVATVGVYIFVILALWRTPLLTPFKLITVYLHEISHALAAKLTCGKVEGIEVNLNEGGVTHTRGGMMCCILPAGYMGSAFWGMVLIVMSPNAITVRIAAAALIASLVITFFLAKNWTLRWLCLAFILFLALVWVIQEVSVVKLLRYTILFIGTMNCLFSVYDIYDDLISRRVHTSDAEKFAELYPLCPCNGVGWGVLWGFFSFLCLCAAVYLGLIILD